AFLILSLCSAAASASGWDRFAEVQIEDTKFAQIITDLIDERGSRFCAATVPCFGNPTEECVLERVRSDNAGAFSYGTMQNVQIDAGVSVFAPKILFTVQVEVDQITSACANDPDCVPSSCTNYPDCLAPQDRSSWSFPVEFELSGAGGEVCLGIEQIAWGVVPANALTAVGLPESFCFGEDLRAVGQLLEPLEAGDTVATYDATQGIVAFRTDYLPPGGTNSTIDQLRETAFETFMNGDAGVFPPGAHNFSVFLSGGALASSIEHTLAQEIAADSKLRIDNSGGFVSGSYFPGTAQATSRTEVYTNSFCDWVSLNPLWVSMQPSISSNGQQVEFTTKLGWDVVDSDVIGCVLSNPIGFLLGPLSTTIAVIWANNKGLPDTPSFGQANCTSVNATGSAREQFECTAAIPNLSATLPGGGSINFSLTNDVHMLDGW
ncbi:MAG: hypothetical protein AAFQ82_25410, partial [Myxococcota bacterium]